MDAREFPGAPYVFDRIFSKKFFEASLEGKDGGPKTIQFSETLQGLSLALLAPRSYYDLFTETQKYYPELSVYWNSVLSNSGKGVQQVSLDQMEGIGIPSEIVKELPPGAFSLLTGTLAFSQDPKVINDLPQSGEREAEQFRVFNLLLWTIYIGCFKQEFFERNHRVFWGAAQAAQKEAKEMFFSSNN